MLTLTYSLTPCYPGIAAEKQHEGFVQDIEGFDKNKLQSSETKVKNTLPNRLSRSLALASRAIKANCRNFNRSTY